MLGYRATPRFICVDRRNEPRENAAIDPELWPEGLPVAQVRIARPTGQVQALERFYHEGIGLPVIGRFGGGATPVTMA